MLLLSLQYSVAATWSPNLFWYVRTHVWQILSIQFIYLIFKDISLLDCVGLQHPCRYHSCNLGICILWYVKLSSFTRWHWLLLFPLVMGITSFPANYIGQGTFLTTLWGDALILTSLIASMTVNALVTGLIVFRIFKVFRKVKNNTTSNEKSLGFTGGRKLRSVIFVIIESGMALFAIQLARVVLSAIILNGNSGVEVAYNLILPIHEMLNVITSSVIATLCFTDNVDLARVSHLLSSWCGCQWDYLSLTSHLW